MRATLERRHGISPGDTFALLGIIGQERAGAVQLTADDSPPCPGRLRPLSAAEVNQIVRDLPTIDPPDGLPDGASLGGVQANDTAKFSLSAGTTLSLEPARASPDAHGREPSSPALDSPRGGTTAPAEIEGSA